MDSALISAAIYGRDESLRHILSFHTPTIQARGQALIYAANNGHLRCLRILRANGSIRLLDLTEAMRRAMRNNEDGGLDAVIGYLFRACSSSTG